MIRVRAEAVRSINSAAAEKNKYCRRASVRNRIAAEIEKTGGRCMNGLFADTLLCIREG